MTEDVQVCDLGLYCWENGINPWSEEIKNNLTPSEWSQVIRSYRFYWAQEQ